MPYTEPSINEASAVYEARIPYTAGAAGVNIPVTVRLVAGTDDIRYDLPDCDAAFQKVLDLLTGDADFGEPSSATKSYQTFEWASPTPEEE